MADCPLHISAPSMVYGGDVIANVRLLSENVDRIEIVLFHTPEIHNIPTVETIRTLAEIKEEEKLMYTVHLPASLEIAAEAAGKRHAAVERIAAIVDRFEPLTPAYYILHIPIETPTLTPVPGVYHTREQRGRLAGWSHRALANLRQIQKLTALDQRLLVENINYSPVLMEPFLEKNLCGLCLDIGHLLLGKEHVRHILQYFLPVTREIHLHGVVGWDEHLSLNVLPMQRVEPWIQLLTANGFDGIVNLEVFEPEHLALSIEMLHEIGYQE